MSLEAMAAAAQLFVAINGISHHFDHAPEGFRPADDYNETNIGLGVELRHSGWVSVLGGLEDSNYNPMYYAGVGPQFEMGWGLSFDVPVGVISREMFYGNDPEGVRELLPAALPRISYTHEGMGAAFYYLPGSDEPNGGSAALFAQFLIEF